MANHGDPPPQWLDASYMQTALRKGLNDPTLSVERVEVGAGSSVGDNFAGQIFRIVSFLSNGRKISTIGKTRPDTPLVQQLEGFKDLFEMEALFYTEILPEIKEFTNIHTVVPIPYHVDFDKKAVFLEDLKEQGFFLLPRHVMVNKDQARLTVEALGRLHGATFKLLQRDPSIKKKFKESLWSSERDGVLSKFVENGQRALEKWMDTYKFPEGWPDRLRSVGKRLEKEYCKVCEFQEGRFNILIHGDSWKNNMMFHKTGDKNDEMRLLDFQIVSYNSFANDLQYFLFNSVDADVLVNDLDFLLECYYNTLMKTAPEIPDLTLERVKTEFAERHFFGLVMVTSFRPLVASTAALDGDKIMKGGTDDGGYVDPQFRSDILKLFPLFEKFGVI